jgi:hypothetical protein
MNKFNYIFVLAFFLSLYSCKVKERNRWSIIEKITITDNTLNLKINNYTASEGSNNILDHEVKFSNLILDSRGTSMDYEEFKRIVFSKEYTDIEIANKISVLGAYSSVIHFHGNGLNKGFLIYKNNSPKEVWAELWDVNGIKRIRVDFTGTLPEMPDSDYICDILSNMHF